MLVLVIKEDEYKLTSDIKKQILLKRELLSKYQDSDIVTIFDRGKEIDKCRLIDIFNRDKKLRLKKCAIGCTIKRVTI